MRGEERRRLQRLERALPVAFEAGGRRGRAVTANVSAGGLLLRSNAALDPGAHIRGRLTLPGGKELAFDAETRWIGKAHGAGATQRPHLLGLEFLGPPEEPYYEFLRRVWEEESRSTAKSSKRPSDRAKEKARASSGARPPAAKRPTPVRAKALRQGLEGMSVTVNGMTEWPDGDSDQTAWWSAGRVAVLVERACHRAVAAALPKKSRALPHRIEVSVLDMPSAVGATLMTRAWLADLDEVAGVLRFDAEVREGEKLLARASHVRVLRS
jgi:hypothetical protein